MFTKSGSTNTQQGTRKLLFRCETREPGSLVSVKTTDVSVYIERNLIIKAVFCVVCNDVCFNVARWVFLRRLPVECFSIWHHSERSIHQFEYLVVAE